MSTLAFLTLFVQACLVQNVYSAYYGAGPAGAYGWGAGVAPYGMGAGCAGPCGYGAPFAAPYAGFAEPFGYGYADYPYAPCGAYGGDGIGNVAVAGELPVGGATAVAGQVPIIGGVEFGGIVPAVGAVTITGSCAYGCGGPYNYNYMY